jgi:hypothetical protein
MLEPSMQHWHIVLHLQCCCCLSRMCFARIPVCVCQGMSVSRLVCDVAPSLHVSCPVVAGTWRGAMLR